MTANPLSALASAVPDGLVEEAGKRAAYIANECQQAAKVMEDTGTFPTGQAIFRDASAQITALLAHIDAQEAQLAGFGAQVEGVSADNARVRAICEKVEERAEAAETALAAAQAREAKLRESLEAITQQAAKDARDVFSEDRQAKEAVDYMEQLIYAQLRKLDAALFGRSRQVTHDDDLIRRGDAVLAVTAADKECLGANGAREFIRALPAVTVGVNTDSQSDSKVIE